MEQMNFKALMYCGNYVSYAHLGNGIYTTDIPRLYSIDKTIESLINDINDYEKQANKINAKSLFTKEFIENLKKCNLVHVTVSL